MKNLKALENLKTSAKEQSKELNNTIEEIHKEKLDFIQISLTNTLNQKLNTFNQNTKEELKQVNLKLNKVYQLNSDIDLTDEERFYVIGSNYNPFTGTFDGHSHEISNLSLKNEKLSFAGLFGRITGTVKNIDAKNMKINGNVNTGG